MSFINRNGSTELKPSSSAYKQEQDVCILITYKNGEEFPLMYDSKQIANTMLKDMCDKIVEGLKAKVYSNDEGSILVIFDNVLNVVMFDVEEG